MQEFIKIPATKRSLSHRSLVFGVGINDSEYLTQIVIDGKSLRCPAYRKWQDMIKRVYCKKWIKKHPSYSSAAICSEWLLFSNFNKWFQIHNVKGYQLDKDIKIKGNKIYSPENCLFLPSEVNNLILDRKECRGEFPIGVCYKAIDRRYVAQVNIDGTTNYIGSFKSPGDAHEAYRAAKNLEIKRKMSKYPEFAKYLEQHLYEN